VKITLGTFLMRKLLRDVYLRPPRVVPPTARPGPTSCLPATTDNLGGTRDHVWSQIAKSKHLRKAKMRTVLLSSCVFSASRYSLQYIGKSFENKAVYCALHSIDCRLNRKVLETTLHSKWEKLSMVSNAIRDNYSKIIWTDCDTLFTNWTQSFDAYAADGLYLSKDNARDHQFNTGVPCAQWRRAVSQVY